MKTPIKVTFLGTGTSGGVPMVSCSCEVCKSTDPRDKRLRTSVLIQTPSTTICIDAGPDFRTQMLQYDVKKIDAILITHGHRDHVGGLDDVRPFNFLQGKWMDIYCDEYAEQMIRDQYSYAFTNLEYAYAPKLNFISVGHEEFAVNDLTIQPITVMHHKLPVKAYRIGDFTYITDAKTIDETEFEKIKGTKILVLNALRATEHDAHFTIAQALDMVDKIKPERAYFIHMSHHFGKHTDMQPTLPDNVTIAYDGLVIEIE
jgi:phosphoribosyl 1,2-cyclic phosphate phosphodiesterase